MSWLSSRIVDSSGDLSFLMKKFLGPIKSVHNTYEKLTFFHHQN